MAPWKIPLIVAAIAVPIVGGFVVNGGVGLAVGALVVMALVVIAVRQRPLGPIGAGVAEGRRRRVLLVVTHPVESPDAIAEIERVARLSEGASADVLVLAPARIGFLDRWTSDVEPARHAAQQNLVATVAALAKAGVEAEARVGDEDVVQAVEDQFQTYPATDVVLVSGPDDAGIESASEELRSRLEAGFQHLVIGEIGG